MKFITTILFATLFVDASAAPPALPPYDCGPDDVSQDQKSKMDKYTTQNK